MKAHRTCGTRPRHGGGRLDVDGAPRRPHAALYRQRQGPTCSSSGWPAPGVELLVAVRRDGVVPVLVVGLGGVYAELLATRRDRPAARHRAASSARCAPARRRAAGATPTSAPSPRLAAQLCRRRLALIELNPVIVTAERGAVGRRSPLGRPRRPSTMNEIAAKLGEVGLPAPISRAGGQRLGRDRRRRRPQRPDRRRLPRPRRPARARARAPRAARRRVHARAAVPRPALQRQPVRVRRRPARRARDPRARTCARRGFECYVADPNLWVPFEDGTSFGQWLDDDKTQRNLEELGSSQERHRGLLGLRARSSTRSASGCAPGARLVARRDARRAPRSRSCCTASRR